MMVYPGGFSSGISISDYDKLTFPKINAILGVLGKQSKSSSVPSSKPQYESFSHANWEKWAKEERKRLGLKKPDGS